MLLPNFINLGNEVSPWQHPRRSVIKSKRTGYFVTKVSGKRKLGDIIWIYFTDEGQTQEAPGDQDEDARQDDQQEGVGQAGGAANQGLTNNLTCWLCKATLQVDHLRKCHGCQEVGFLRLASKTRLRMRLVLLFSWLALVFILANIRAQALPLLFARLLLIIFAGMLLQ